MFPDIPPLTVITNYLAIHMFKNILPVLIFLLGIITKGFGQTPVSIPDNFEDTPLPETYSKEWYALNLSKYRFDVQIVDGKLDITPFKEKPLAQCKVANGTMVGINHGEWGGKLIFLPADSTKSLVQIKSGNIQCIFPFKDKIYFLEGLAHGATNKGALYELEMKQNEWIPKKILDFDDAPRIHAIYHDTLFIVTHQNFYIVKDQKKELLFEHQFWGGLGAASISVFDERNVFLGIAAGIVKLDLTTKETKFYKYKVLQ
jgi:hypothetical protein